MNYFDYAATCPLDRDAADTYLKAATEYYGNSQSLHDIGCHASSLLENCRREFAYLLQAAIEGIYFTSGGTESNFLAIHALLSAAKKPGKHIITSMAEHSSIHNTLKKLKIEEHYEITELPFNRYGFIELEQLQSAIREDTVLITIQHGNPEIGSLQPLEDISKLCKESQILLHSDCVHTFGKIDFKTVALFVDSLSISGHKFYGPKGVGVLYINPYINCKPFLSNVSHESGFRPGTVNVPGVTAMTVAAQKAYQNLHSNASRYDLLRKIFIEALEPIHDQCLIYHSADTSQLPSTIGMRVKGIEGQLMMLECNRRGYAISTGSACQVGMQSISKTMNAMGITGKEAKEFIRISFGWNTSAAETEELGKAIIKITQEIKQSYNC